MTNSSSSAPVDAEGNPFPAGEVSLTFRNAGEGPDDRLEFQLEPANRFLAQSGDIDNIDPVVAASFPALLADVDALVEKRGPVQGSGPKESTMVMAR